MRPSDDESQITTTVTPPIHGDVLEAVLSYLPLIYLIPKSLVSKTWNDAVSSTILKTHKPQPWLILHTQSTSSPYLTTTIAYDPSSNQWIEIHQPSIEYVSALRSSDSKILYMISPSKFSFSFDPLHLTWHLYKHHTTGPRVWLLDPIVAVVGQNVVVAGGGYDFEDDSLVVEIYNMDLRDWTKPEPMPEFFKGSESATWHSIASDDFQLFVIEKSSGVLHSFDPVTNTWYGPYDMHRDDVVVVSHLIGFLNNRLILIGVFGDFDSKDVIGVKMWKVNRESSSFECDEIAEMPVDLVEKLKGNHGNELEFSSIAVRMAGNVVYIFNRNRTEEVIVCEFLCDGGGDCRWWSVASVVATDRNIMDRAVFTCSKVGIQELQRANLANRRFRAVNQL